MMIFFTKSRENIYFYNLSSFLVCVISVICNLQQCLCSSSYEAAKKWKLRNTSINLHSHSVWEAPCAVGDKGKQVGEM